jgi:hypothetical protein
MTYSVVKQVEQAQLFAVKGGGTYLPLLGEGKEGEETPLCERVPVM